MQDISEWEVASLQRSALFLGIEDLGHQLVKLGWSQLLSRWFGLLLRNQRLLDILLLGLRTFVRFNYLFGDFLRSECGYIG